MSRTIQAVLALFLLGCGGSQSAPNEDTDRSELTAEACEAGGGTVVGDIGDGAIHRPDFRCPSGSKPSGAIRAPGAGPVAVEGSVCCPK